MRTVTTSEASCSPCTPSPSRYRAPFVLKFSGAIGKAAAGEQVSYLTDGYAGSAAFADVLAVRPGYSFNPGVPFDVRAMSARFIVPPGELETLGVAVQLLKANTLTALTLALNTGDGTKNASVATPIVFATSADELDIKVVATSNAGLATPPAIEVTLWGTSALVLSS